MNNVTLYPLVRDRRVYCVEAYGLFDAWSVELDEPIGGAPDRKSFNAIARAAGWIPVQEVDVIRERRMAAK